MDQMGDFSLIAPNDKQRRLYEDLANMTKRLKQFWVQDLFDKNLNHPVEDEEHWDEQYAKFERYFEVV